MNRSKDKLWQVIKHFPQVVGCGIEIKGIKVLLKEPLESFITQFEGFPVFTEVTGEVKAQSNGQDIKRFKRTSR